jgi:hypothetical protein
MKLRSSHPAAVPPLQREKPLPCGNPCSTGKEKEPTSSLLWLHWIWASAIDSLEYFCVAISVFDVVSDMVVAYEFYSSGFPWWSYAVLASIVISNIVYTLFGIEEFFRRSQVSRWALFLLLFPVAQFVPLMHWFCAKRKERESGPAHRASRRVSHETPDEVAMSTVCKEEYVACAAEIHQGSRIRQKISRDLSTHWLFLVETIVESVPQCVLQLLAVSQMGTAMTPIQMASLLLSFCSIASKAHFISYSPTLSMYVFKVGLVIHDVASMFLLCSSMLASSSAPPAGEGLPLPFFPDVPVSLPAFIVVWKAVAVFLVIYLIFLVSWIMMYFTGPDRDVAPLIIVAFGVTICIIPLALAIECLRFSVILLALVWIEPDPSAMEYVTLSMAFVTNGSDGAECERRLRHCFNYANCVASTGCFIGDSQNSLYQTAVLLRRKYHKEIEDHAQQKLDKFLLIISAPIMIMLVGGGLLSTVCTYWHVFSFAAEHGDGWSVMERCFAVVAVASLVLPLGNLNKVWWSIRTCALLKSLQCIRWHNHRAHLNFSSVVKEYRRVSTQQLLCLVVPAELVPSDVLKVLAAISGPDSVDVTHWRTSEFSQLVDAIF